MIPIVRRLPTYIGRVGIRLHVTKCAYCSPSTSTLTVRKLEHKPKIQKNKRIDQEMVENVKQLDELTEILAKNMSKFDDDDELRRLFGSGLVKNRRERKRVEEMEDENDTNSRPANQVRSIIYDEGELDKSNFSKPPSSKNPHPFDPSTLPPTHARSLAAYVNHLPSLQLLVDIGVNLYEVDLEPRIGQELLKLDEERDIKPKLAFLLKEIGVQTTEIGSYLTRNPFFFIQKNEDLKKRLKYLQNHKFKKHEIAKIVVAYRYWLNTEIPIIDSRLGWLQRQFELNGSEMRRLIVKEPRLIMFGVGPLQRLVLFFNGDLQFEPWEVKKIMLQDPRVFMTGPDHIRLSYNYMRRVMGLTNEQIADYPLGLRCWIANLRRRHEFVARCKLNQYNPELPNYISLRKLLHPSDKYFSETVCRKFLADYEKFLKTF